MKAAAGEHRISLSEELPAPFLLSIIIPFYNAEATLRRTLESLSALPVESRGGIEIVAVDDGSADCSLAIAEEMRQPLLPAELVLLSQKNTGTSGARNAGLRICRGRWIFFLDADDELAFDPVPFITTEQEATCLLFSVRLFRGGAYRFTIKPSPIGSARFFQHFSERNPLHPSSILFQKCLIENYFDLQFRYLEDWLFWIQNPKIFMSVRILPHVAAAIVHSHGKNKTSNSLLHGKYRQLTAEKALADYGSRLARVERNNFMIQSRIGMLQQGLNVPAGTFLLLPCSPLLYLKMLVYHLPASLLSRIGPYGN